MAALCVSQIRTNNPDRKFFYVACSWRDSVIKMDEDMNAKKEGMLPEYEDSSVGQCLFVSASCIRNIFGKGAEVRRLFTVYVFAVQRRAGWRQ